MMADTAFALRRLARHKGMSRAQVLADLIVQADSRVAEKMDDDAFAEYVTR